MLNGLKEDTYGVSASESGEQALGAAAESILLAKRLVLEPGNPQLRARIGACLDLLEAEYGEAAAKALKTARGYLEAICGVEHATGYNPVNALVDELKALGSMLPATSPGDVSRLTTDSMESRPMKDRNRPVAFFGEEHVLGEYIRWFRNSGTDTLHTDKLAKLAQVVRKHDPRALIVDLPTGGRELEFLDGLAPVTSSLDNQAVRIIFISDRADQEVRLRAVEAGGHAFLTKPVMPQQLLQQLDPQPGSSRQVRVLVTGERSVFEDAFVDVMRDSGMQVRMLGNASQLLLSVINFSPDLVVLTGSLGDVGCETAARMIHQLSDFEDLPVICLGKPVVNTGALVDISIEWLDIENSTPEAAVERARTVVTAAQARRARLQQLQACDAVTGMISQAGFFPMLERVTPAAAYTGLVLLEIENIQQANPDLTPEDVNGLLAEIAGLFGRFGGTTDIGARVADYTFAFLVSRESREEISKLGQFMSHALSSRILDAGSCSLTLGCSAGVAVAAGKVENGMSLYTLALKACKEARQAGVNRVSVRSLDAERRERQSDAEFRLVESLSSPAVFDRMSLVFQPIASLRGNSIEKYEALLRMQDENGQPVSPSHFVPVADSAGLMPSIDRWVVEQAIMRLQARENAARFFIKLGSGTLRDEDFIPFVRECLEKYGVAAECLVFEISCANITSGIRHAAAFASKVVALGCDLSLDHSDFTQDLGALFEHIPASFVKLDSSAVTEICSDPEKQARLKNVISESEKQEASLIAGYIETAHCLQLLWQSGVHYIQGNFLQEPNEKLDFDFGAEAP